MESIVWDIDNVVSIGGEGTEVLGSPKVIETPGGKALEFDGVDDGLIIDKLPLAGVEKFTLEIVFRPDEGGTKEQRFLHLQQTSPEHRILIETRVPGDSSWYIDTYITNAKGDKALLDAANSHPLGKWYSAALIYDGGKMRHYINGLQEMSGELPFAPLNEGKTSIGVRMNQVFWFKGAIRKVRFTSGVLRPDELLLP